MRPSEFDFARSEDKDAISASKIEQLRVAYLARARKMEASEAAIQAIETYFSEMSALIRKVEQARLSAEPGHLRALASFAERAYRRPLSQGEQAELIAFYQRITAERRPQPRRRDSRYGREHPDVAAFLLPARAGRSGSVAATVVGLCSGQPAQLLPLVEHARPTNCWPTPPRAICASPMC